MVRVARGTRGLQGWNISGRAEGAFSPEQSGKPKEAFGFSPSQVQPTQNSVHEGGCAHEGGMWMEVSSRAIQHLS